MSGEEEAISENPSFHPIDSLILALMLLLSCGIGIFYSVTGGKQKTSKEFLMADQKLTFFPVGMSLIASFMSGVTYLGVPADVYRNGTMFWGFAVAHVIACLLISRTYLPVFYRLGLTSVYEYFELRFSVAVRRCALVCFYIWTFIYLGIVVYAPCLAVAAETQLSFTGALFLVGIVCIFYTTIGGMKAVVWADVFQMVVCVFGFLAVIIKGSLDHDGFQGVYNISLEGGRIDLLNFDPNPQTRHTVWSTMIGGIPLWTYWHGLTQYQVQRYLSCKSLKHCYASIAMYAIGMVCITVFAVMVGLVAYAYYHDCDPYLAGKVIRNDQILPYLVINVFQNVPGVPGLFLSGVLCAALSTLSSALNGLAAVTGEDIVKTFISPKIEEKKYTMVLKLLAVFYGIVVIGLAFLALALGKIAQTAYTAAGTVNGPVLALFTLGMMVPWANTKGALAGFFTGIGMGLWVSVGHLMNPQPSSELALSTDGCLATDLFNVSTTTMMPTTTMMMSTPEPDRSGVTAFYDISYAWYSMLTFLTTMVIGMIVSALTGPNPRPDPKLISPVCETLFCCLPRSWKEKIEMNSLLIDDEKPSNPGDVEAHDLNGVNDDEKKNEKTELETPTLQPTKAAEAGFEEDDKKEARNNESNGAKPAENDIAT